MARTSLAPTQRLGRIATLAVVPLALVASGVLVSQASHSAFSATTANEGNAWSMGSVALSDDDAQGALFTAANLKPGSTGSNCIAVTSTGSLPSDVRLYATSPQQTKGMGDQITVQIEQGTGGGFGTCDGFAADASLYSGTLTNLGTSRTSFANGLGTWQTTGAESETTVYRISYAVAGNAPASSMGGTASLGFTWEAQNS